MDKQALLQFRDKLLSSGVSYFYVKRSLRELQDHYSDLQQLAIDNGCTANEADKEALKNIGSLEKLAQNIINQPNLLSVAHRYPKLTMILLPVISYLVIVLAIVFLMAFLLSVEGIVMIPEITEVPAWLQSCYQLCRLITMYLLPYMAALVLGVYALKRQVKFKYAAWGIVLVCIVGCSFSVSIAWPDLAAQVKGSLSASFYYGLNQPNKMHIAGNEIRLLSVLLLAFSSIYLYQKYTKDLLV